VPTKNEPPGLHRRIGQWILRVSIGGGILAAIVSFLLTWGTRPPSPKISEKVAVALISDNGHVSTVQHRINLKNQGLPLTNLHVRISFSPTAGKPSIKDPVVSADPDSMITTITARWETPTIYSVDMQRFPQGSGLVLSFDADQELLVSIEELGDNIKQTSKYDRHGRRE
jgi:hypothetical protein